VVNRVDPEAAEDMAATVEEGEFRMLTQTRSTITSLTTTRVGAVDTIPARPPEASSTEVTWEEATRSTSEGRPEVNAGLAGEPHHQHSLSLQQRLQFFLVSAELKIFVVCLYCLTVLKNICHNFFYFKPVLFVVIVRAYSLSYKKFA
jgi:hypothetical protein